MRSEKKAGLFCGFFSRKGELLAYVELFQNFKDPKGFSVDHFWGRLTTFYSGALVPCIEPTSWLPVPQFPILHDEMRYG